MPFTTPRLGLPWRRPRWDTAPVGSVEQRREMRERVVGSVRVKLSFTGSLTVFLWKIQHSVVKGTKVKLDVQEGVKKFWEPRKEPVVFPVSNQIRHFCTDRTDQQQAQAQNLDRRTPTVQLDSWWFPFKKKNGWIPLRKDSWERDSQCATREIKLHILFLTISCNWEEKLVCRNNYT